MTIVAPVRLSTMAMDPVGPCSPGREPLLQQVLGLLLQAVVHRDVDPEAAAAFAGGVVGRAAEEGPLALQVGVAQAEAGVVEHRLLGGDEDLGGQGLELLVGHGHQRLVEGVGRFLLGDVPLFEHLADDPVPGVQRVVGVVAQVVEGGVADRHRQGGRLGDAELAEGLAEVLLGGRLHAVGVGPEVDRVEVELEDLLLGVAALQLHGDGGLGHLALQGGLGADEVQLHHLLGDGGAALAGAAPAHVADEGPDDRGVVDADVGPEVGVLGREHRRHHEVGDLLEGHRLAVALGELAEAHPVGGVHLREAAEVGEVQGQAAHVGDPGPAEVVEAAGGGVAAEEGEQAHPARGDDGDGGQHGHGDQPASTPIDALGLMNGDFHRLPRRTSRGGPAVPG